MMLFSKKLAHPPPLNKSYSNKNGFTLIEALLSLIVLAIIMHSLSMSVTHYYRIEEKFRTDKGLEFQLFTKIISLELENYQFISASRNTITLSDQSKQFTIIHSNQKIYKTPGHHPYLYEVQQWYLDWSQPILTITVVFTNQQQYSTYLIID